MTEPLTDDLAASDEIIDRIGMFDWSSTPLGPMEQWPPRLMAAVSAYLGSPAENFLAAKDVRADEVPEQGAGGDKLHQQEGSLWEVTADRKSLAISLEESEERLQALMCHNPSLVFLKDEAGRYVYLNDAYEKQFVCAKDWYQKTDFDFWPKETAELFRANDAYVLTLGEVQQYLEDSTDLNGTRFCWICYKFPYTDSQGRKYVGGIGIDVTARVLAEEGLFKSEERFRLAVHASRTMVYDLDVRSFAVNAMHGLSDLLGYCFDEAELTLQWWDDRIHPEDLQTCHQAYQKMLDNRQDHVLEYRVRHKDGRLLWVEDHAAPVCDAEGRIDRVVGTVTDITERKQAELALRQSEAALKTLNDELEKRVEERTKELRERDRMLLFQSRQAAMGEMIGNIAHQWRQPLNALGLLNQRLLLLYDTGKLDRELLKEDADRSMALIKHMSATIDDFRNYFKPDKSMIEFRLSEAIAKTLALVEDGYKDQNIAIDVTLLDDPVVFGYRNEYAQALLNIVNNARDVLSERGSQDPRVTISAFSEAGKAVITVADNAGGIAEDIIHKVFEPYFTTKGPQQGTGIGLFMSKSIIERNMRGSLSVCNTPTGAEFRMEV